MNTIKAIIILNNEGKRVLAQYYDDKINATHFDKDIFTKTKSPKARDDIMIVNNLIVIHRCVSDLHMYVAGNRNENPLTFDRVLCCLVEVVTVLSTRSVEHNSLLENLDQIILAFDEICDRGMVLETDPDVVLQRVCLKDDVAEQSMAQVLQSASEHLKIRWIRS